MMRDVAIGVEGVSKSFGDLAAVRDVSFEIRAGEIFSLLGPNGAGKSTTIGMICGLLTPNAGDVRVMGHSIRTGERAAKACLGVVPQEVALYPDLSARENLVFWGKMYGLRGKLLDQRVDELLQVISLSGRQKNRVSTFSGGMKRRVNVAAALLHRPQVVIMDEPTVGIDPQSRRYILDHVKELNRQGMTLLYTTHYMEEAQELSHRVGIIDHGRLIAAGSQDELVRLVGEQARVDLVVSGVPEQVGAAWQSLAGVSKVTIEENRLAVLVNDSNVVLPALFEAARNRGVRIVSVEIREPNLETVFLHLTGRALRDG